MKYRGLVLVPISLSLVLSVTACNEGKLVAGATCTPAAASAAAVSSANGDVSTTVMHPTRPIVGVLPPHMNATAGVTAQDLLTAMDVDPTAFTNVAVTGDPRAYTVFTTLGTVLPSAGTSFAWLSTGVAGSGTPSTLDASATTTQPGTNLGAPGCGANNFDCTSLTLTFVVPDGLHSVAFDFNFMSVEYPEFVGLGYNDSFVVSMSSPSHSFSNVVFDHNNNPINIDSVLFTEPCQQLTGTGFDLPGYDPTYNNCDAGGTGLLTTTAPVEPGETVTMTFEVYDSGDSIYDSAVMLDNLRVSPDPVGTPNTGTPTPPAPTPTPDSCPAA